MATKPAERYLEAFDKSYAEVRTISTLLFATAILTLLAFYTARFAWTRFQVEQIAGELAQIEKNELEACDAPTFMRYFGESRDESTCKDLLNEELKETRNIRREQLNVSLPVLGMSSNFSDLLIVFPAIAIGMWLLLRAARQRLHRAMQRVARLMSTEPDAAPTILLDDLHADEQDQAHMLRRLSVLTTLTSVVVLTGDIFDAIASASQLSSGTHVYIGCSVMLTLLVGLTAKQAIDVEASKHPLSPESPKRNNATSP